MMMNREIMDLEGIDMLANSLHNPNFCDQETIRESAMEIIEEQTAKFTGLFAGTDVTVNDLCL